jgi:uncharacterized protein
MIKDEIIHSNLEREYTSEGHRAFISIYRMADTLWSLEVIAENGLSTVWDHLFETDQLALQEALKSLRDEGIAAFLKPDNPDADSHRHDFDSDMLEQLDLLDDDELEELENFLLDLACESSMLFDELDGLLHAIAIGPELVEPSKWLPLVWDHEKSIIPPVQSIEQLNRIVGLIMRHYNSIVASFETDPPMCLAFFGELEVGDEEFENGEMWCQGFAKGVMINREAWQALFDHPQGREWYRPIGLLGEENYSDDQSELTATLELCEDLTLQVEDSVLKIHQFWLPYRQALYERELAKKLQEKVGRNDPCPCSSGKKFKKCCGFSENLH